ncbi:MAG TPA: neutral zinc metallopeptidase [Acidimicrobiales bacterium]
MRWSRSGRRSTNLEDRRGASSGGFGGGLPGMGGGMRLPFPMGGGLGKIGLPALLLVVLTMVLGGRMGGGGGTGFDIGTGVDGLPASPAAPTGGASGLDGAPDADAALVDFVSFVLDDVQGTWDELFRDAGRTYEPAELVLFEGATQTGCGVGQEATGPFYCPLDKKAYLDLTFFRELRTRFGAPGDFAQAYVIAHELGHHVQNITGVNADVRRQQQRHPDDANELSVRQELQADCFAGVWAHSTYRRDILERGDLEEGLAAAAAVGDDRLQRQAGGRVDPHTWTHGSSEQRMRWFSRGYETGDPDRCDSFSGDL